MVAMVATAEEVAVVRRQKRSVGVSECVSRDRCECLPRKQVEENGTRLCYR